MHVRRVTSGVGGTFQSPSAVDLGRRGGRDQTRRISKRTYLREGGGTRRPGRIGGDKQLLAYPERLGKKQKNHGWR